MLLLSLLSLPDGGRDRSNWGQMPVVALALTLTPCPPVFAHMVPVPFRVLLSKKAGPSLLCAGCVLYPASLASGPGYGS